MPMSLMLRMLPMGILESREDWVLSLLLLELVNCLLSSMPLAF
jgi:hypothetical protein